ncbi:MAG: HAD family hydrolase [Magnetovibrionaceae bacterium]
MTKPAAWFLDFDGVLAQSTAIKDQAFEALYAEHGPDVVAKVLAHHQARGGISRVEKIRFCHRTLLGIELDEPDLQGLAQRFGTLVEEAVVACPDGPGARAFLARTREPVFVVSGTPEPELRRIVAARGLSDGFEAVHGSPDEKPEIVERLLEAYHLDRGRCVFVGDAMTDYNAARACNMAFLGFHGLGGEHPFPPGTRVVDSFDGIEQQTAAELGERG